MSRASQSKDRRAAKVRRALTALRPGDIWGDRLMGKRYGLRRCRRVLPGWPQAVWLLTCGHRITVPTWHNGRCRPKPAKKVRCEECWHAEFDHRCDLLKAALAASPSKD